MSVVGELKGEVIESGEQSIRLVDVNCEVPAGGFVEVVGGVQNSSAVKPVRVTALGEDFNVENYNKLCDFINGSYSHLF